MNRPPLEFDHIHLIAKDPQATVAWYVEILGAEVTADTMARGAPQIFLEVGGKIIIVRGKRPNENLTWPKAVQRYDDFSSHGEWGTDHFGFHLLFQPRQSRARWIGGARRSRLRSRFKPNAP